MLNVPKYVFLFKKYKIPNISINNKIHLFYKPCIKFDYITNIKFMLESQHVVHAFETNVFAKPLIKEGKVVGRGSLQLRKTNYLLLY